MVFRFVLYKDAAGLILKKELPAPRGFGGGDDTTNEHGKLFFAPVPLTGKAHRRRWSKRWSGLRPAAGSVQQKTAAITGRNRSNRFWKRALTLDCRSYLIRKRCASKVECNLP